MLYVYITYLHTECVLYIRIQTGKSVKFINFILHIRQKCDLKSFLWRSGSRSNPKVSNKQIGSKEKGPLPWHNNAEQGRGTPFLVCASDFCLEHRIFPPAKFCGLVGWLGW